MRSNLKLRRRWTSRTHLWLSKYWINRLYRSVDHHKVWKTREIGASGLGPSSQSTSRQIEIRILRGPWTAMKRLRIRLVSWTRGSLINTTIQRGWSKVIICLCQSMHLSPRLLAQSLTTRVTTSRRTQLVLIHLRLSADEWVLTTQPQLKEDQSTIEGI